MVALGAALGEGGGLFAEVGEEEAVAADAGIDVAEHFAQGLSPAEALFRVPSMAPFVKRQSSSQPPEQEKSYE